MSACSEVRKWITEEIRQPFEEFISKAEEQCTEARRWVEHNVRKPVERRRTKVEKKCKKKKCKWYCLCCNKWFCWLETIIERIVEWIIEVVGEWLVETVCKIIIKVIKIVVEIVITIVRFIIVGFTCLFTNPQGALDALIDLWYDLVDIVCDVGDLVSDVIDAVSDLLDITREFILDIADKFGPIGRFFGGILAGILGIARRVVDGIGRIWDGILDVIEGILHLDFCFSLEGMVDGVGFGLGQAILGVTGVLSLASNGARDSIERDSLRDWLSKYINEHFKGDLLQRIEKLINTESSSFGIDWPVYPLRCTISSHSPIDLKVLHNNGEINLYKIAGYAPFGCKDTTVIRSVYELVYKDTDYRVSVGDIRAYLREGPEAAPEFVLIAGNKRTFKDVLEVATQKLRQMAINLDRRPLGTFEIYAEERILSSATPIARRITNVMNLSDICDLPAVLVFGYDPRHFGLASAYWIDGDRVPTAATIRISFMTYLFGTVLAHEMGHCFSLKHNGHDGMENIMYTMEDEAGLDPITGKTIIEYLIVGGEPRFTLRDSKDAWTWILTKALDCLSK
jgi:hypothetical protein